ncbi:imidazoleglycerol-phosphate dehydratase [Lottiidibacillus patelloidae]|uniref:Imidazoleglycerol-phosphate dehydratase n=1 Tax=Lottiidibacillus patelloidae TaxID=2670334 RepID=A0A263BTW2_9BACI|nr:imidazoleglycerol-phosphate dehydratase HisB [Lottiidibacillus patelloidae]OZM56992.1 imidazoleglycerol-phosphate dehydratase [Lottiidibacillus patelloidae]
MRVAEINRETLETKVAVKLTVDGTGKSSIQTGVGFLDHMLTLLAFHSGMDINVVCEGDLYVDDHHSVEDIGLALGQALKNALGDKKGIKRYSSLFIPMDESLCRIALDISNRPTFVYNVPFTREKIGNIDTQNFKEFLKSFVNEARITLHIDVLYGENDHHKIEAVFKALARAIKEAVTVTSNKLPSSKGVL